MGFGQIAQRLRRSFSTSSGSVQVHSPLGLESLEHRRLLSTSLSTTTTTGTTTTAAITAAATTLPAPVAVSPGSTTSPGPLVTSLNPTLTWNPVATTTVFTGYQINLYDVTLKKSSTYTTGVSVHSFTIPTSSTLAQGDTFVWNVRALDGTVSGPPSNYLYFHTPTFSTTLPAPVAVSPGSSTSPGPVVSSLTPTLTWKPVTTATPISGYLINLYDATTGKLTQYTASSTATSLTIPSTAKLAYGNHYVWNIRIVQGNTFGPPSNYLYFQTSSATATLPAPVAVSPGSIPSPGSLVTSLRPTLTWQPISGVTFTGYQVTLYDVTTHTSVNFNTGTSVHSFTIPTSAQLTANNTYVWYVRAVNGTVSGPVSNYLFFHTPVLPQPVITSPGSTTSPGPVITTLTPTLTWKAVTGISFDSYQINLYDVTTKTFQSIQVSPTATSYTLPAGMLTKGDTYVWNLRIKIGSVTGPESTTYLYFQAE